jgi:hypothetical protein
MPAPSQRQTGQLWLDIGSLGVWQAKGIVHESRVHSSNLL